MKVPTTFPEGCIFVASFDGDEYVRFPDGTVYKLADSGEELLPRSDLPRKGAPIAEAAFLICASDLRAFHRKSNQN